MRPQRYRKDQTICVCWGLSRVSTEDGWTGEKGVGDLFLRNAFGLSQEALSEI